jgi:uncharacterized protein YidB (DUF937 family)
MAAITTKVAKRMAWHPHAGSDVVRSLAQRSGLSEQELMAQLSQILPGVLDRLTTSGRLPA